MTFVGTKTYIMQNLFMFRTKMHKTLFRITYTKKLRYMYLCERKMYIFVGIDEAIQRSITSSNRSVKDAL